MSYRLRKVNLVSTLDEMRHTPIAFVDRPVPRPKSRHLTPEQFDAILETAKNGKALLMSDYDGTQKYVDACRAAAHYGLRKRGYRMRTQTCAGKLFVWCEKIEQPK